jgi:hypothetical protein
MTSISLLAISQSTGANWVQRSLEQGDGLSAEVRRVIPTHGGVYGALQPPDWDTDPLPSAYHGDRVLHWRTFSGGTAALAVEALRRGATGYPGNGFLVDAQRLVEEKCW